MRMYDAEIKTKTVSSTPINRKDISLRDNVTGRNKEGRMRVSEGIATLMRGMIVHLKTK